MKEGEQNQGSFIKAGWLLSNPSVCRIRLRQDCEGKDRSSLSHLGFTFICVSTRRQGDGDEQKTKEAQSLLSQSLENSEGDCH